MIHVNPYDTGFDENSHVMKFSAVAREIQTNTMSASQRYAGVVRASEIPTSPAVAAGPFVRKAIPEMMRFQAPANADKDIVVMAGPAGETPSGRASEVERERVEAELLVTQGQFSYSHSTSSSQRLTSGPRHRQPRSGSLKPSPKPRPTRSPTTRTTHSSRTTTSQTHSSNTSLTSLGTSVSA